MNIKPSTTLIFLILTMLTISCAGLTGKTDAELDALLRAKWKDMKNNLASGNIEGAIKYFSQLTRERYTQIFTAIGPGLPGLAAQMGDIEPVYMRDSLVKYRVKRDEVINGEQVKITHYIYFSKGLFGLWYIDSF